MPKQDDKKIKKIKNNERKKEKKRKRKKTIALLSNYRRHTLEVTLQ